MTGVQGLEVLGDKAGWTLPHIVRRQAQRYGERPFISFQDAGDLSFAGLHRESDRVAVALAALGVRRGDRVMMMMRNRPEFILLAIGCGRVGAIFVPINTELKGFSLQHQLTNCAPKALFLDTALSAAFADVGLPPDTSTEIVVLDRQEDGQTHSVFGDLPLRSFAHFLAQGASHPAVPSDPSPAELGCIMYTSGTTGPAKGVLMPHAHLALYSLPADGLKLSERDVYYVCLPLFHVNALFVQVFASLLCGARVHCVERFSPNRWLAEVRQCGATVTNLLGVMTQLVFNTSPQLDDHVNDLRAILAVPVSNDWIERFCERFGVRIFQGYGMTECNLVAYSSPDDPPVSGCSGTIRSTLFDVAIVDPETDELLADNEVGEIVVRPKIPHAFMQGYFGMPEKSLEACKNLWFHTGDAGRIEGGRTLHFVDRIKDRIRRRGENVSAYEIEQVLATLPGVAECAVVGVQVGDSSLEQEVIACIVRQQGVELSHLQVLEHCIARVPRFAVPRFVEFVDALPRTATDKVQRHLLRARGTDFAWDREREGYGGRTGVARSESSKPTA